MNNVDHSTAQFEKDEYGNLIPKDNTHFSADEAYGKDVKPDNQIKDEYGIED